MKISIINPETPPQTAPERVQNTVVLLQSLGVWHIVSRNSKATSCRDAAQRRYRLGHIGIPLHDEMKSLHMIGKFPNRQSLHVLLHARANHQFDLECARIAVGAESLEHLDREALAELCGARYGTVNPFSEATQWIQVFDRRMQTALTPPHTMMTNAGDLEWAVEFYPGEVIEALKKVSPKVIVADIVNNSNNAEHPKRPVFGILTGNGPESGQTLWRYLNGQIHQALEKQNRMFGDISYPRVIIDSVPEMGLSMELQERNRDVVDVVCRGAERLLTAGATHIAIACNTTQIFKRELEQICADRGANFVSIVDAVLAEMPKQHLHRLTLMGIPKVANMGEHSAYAVLNDHGVVPMEPAAELHLQELGYMVKMTKHGGSYVKALNKLTHAIKVGVKTDYVLVALTEISTLLENLPSSKRKTVAGKKIVDPLELYANHLARIYLNSMAPDEELYESWEA